LQRLLKLQKILLTLYTKHKCYKGKEGIMKMAEIDTLEDEYEQYVFEMEEMGKEPMSFEAFRRMVLAGQG
jgi:uncharacterized protein YerC